MLKRKGFTLIELIVVVIIIGILATFAVPEYLKATERAKGAKAKNALALIAQAEKMYRAEYDNYVYLNGRDGIQADDVLGEFIELSALDYYNGDKDWEYKVCPSAAFDPHCGVTTPSADHFIAVALRRSGRYQYGEGQGTTDRGSIMVNQDGVWDDRFTDWMSE